MTHKEASQLIDEGVDPSTIEAYEWGYPGSNVVVSRKKWTRVRPGLYVRLFDKFEITIEECEPGENCGEDERGWVVRYNTIQLGGSFQERSDWAYATYREAKGAVEREFTPPKKLKAKLLR